LKTATATLILLLVAGCGGYDGRTLVPGQSTGAEVERLMGPAADKRTGADGQTVLWFPRLPYGRVSYAARIGKDDKLIGVEQRLTRANLEQLKPGTSRDSDVRDLLGPPNRVDWFERRQVNAWTYQAQGVEPQLIVVEVSKDGVVRSVQMFNDPEAVAGDGPA
jgi:hypothetical protein